MSLWSFLASVETPLQPLLPDQLVQVHLSDLEMAQVGVCLFGTRTCFGIHAISCLLFTTPQLTENAHFMLWDFRPLPCQGDEWGILRVAPHRALPAISMNTR